MPYKLVYFNSRGRVQALRYIFADLGVDFEDQVVTIAQWPALKPHTPFGQLPVFYDGDLELGQSNTILRYVAKKHGLYGDDVKEAALIDMVNDQQEDIRLSYARIIYRDYENGKDDFIKNLPKQLATLEKTLVRNNGGSGFFVANKISFADYTVFDLLDNLIVLSPTALDSFPLLKGFHERIASREKIAEHRATDRFKNTRINGNGKQ